MALSVSCRLGSKVSVPYIDGGSKGGFGNWHPSDLWIRRMRSCGAECPNRSCAYGDNGTAKDIHIGVVGKAEGPNLDEVVPSVSAVKEEAILGQSFLGERLLCGYSRTGCGYGAQVCALPGKERATVGADETNRLTM
jgi:hypothetical protein